MQYPLPRLCIEQTRFSLLFMCVRCLEIEEEQLYSDSGHHGRLNGEAGHSSHQSPVFPSQARLPCNTQIRSQLWWKTGLEGNISSSITYVTFLVYFLTMASSAGREITNSGFDPRRLSRKKKKVDFLMLKNL